MDNNIVEHCEMEVPCNNLMDTKATDRKADISAANSQYFIKLKKNSRMAAYMITMLGAVNIQRDR